MTKRTALLTMLIVSLVILPGCPEGSGLVGDWTMIVSYIAGDVGLNLLANGEAASFIAPGGSTPLDGTLTWEVNGSEFILRQVIPQGDAIYIGRLVGDSSISGVFIVWDGQVIGTHGTWSAVKQ